ncbi:hypothetical protein B566_EDAN016436 [Ephemera danica]|nr:hypothetical protein B566_EDAN016436 [Ephemera danica]
MAAARVRTEATAARMLISHDLTADRTALSNMLLRCCLLLALALMSLAERPNYIECANGDECGPGKCCMIGMHRYSIPTCLPYSEAGEPCRPWDNEPVNLTLSYPDGAHVTLQDVHRQFCPCSQELVCSLLSLACFRPNSLDNDIPLLS